LGVVIFITETAQTSALAVLYCCYAQVPELQVKIRSAPEKKFS
jgi:hypothetical protein